MQNKIRLKHFVAFLLLGIFLGFNPLHAENPPPLPAGTYTIGGTNPDYISFNAAVSDLTSQGIGGAVVFEVRNGSYIEQVSIDTIPGASATHTVTFRSESMDSSAVILSYASISSNFNFVLRLYGADYIHFEHLTIQATGQSLFRAVQLSQGASYNVFTHCRFISPLASGNSFAQNVFSSFGGQSAAENDNFNTLSHNRFENGTHGLVVYGYGNNAGEREQGWQILNNHFVNASFRTIILFRQEDFHVKGNLLESPNATGAAMHMNACYGSGSIEQNQINASNSTHGIGLEFLNCYADSISPFRVVNNFVTAGLRGIYNYSGKGFEVLHNSLVTPGTNSNSYSLYIGYVQGIRVLNNAMVNYGGGRTLFLVGNYTSTDTIDYNNLYTSGTNLVYDGSVNYTDLAAWQSAGSFDTHSLSGDPVFTPPNLHTQSPVLNGEGLFLADVPIDIDGDLRQQSPDIGADEFDILGADASLSSFIIPQSPFAAGNYTLQAVVESRASDSLVNYQLNWKLNGVSQTPITRTGPLRQYERDTILLTNINLNDGEIYQLEAWVNLSASQTDIFLGNDSLSTAPFAPLLDGDYTLGGSSPDFIDFHVAIEVLEAGGLGDTVRILVRPGTYNEQFTLQDIPGVSCLKPLVFEGESGDSSDVVISFESNSSENYVCRIHGLSGLTFRYLTFEATDNTYTRVITLTDTTDCLSWEHCQLKSTSLNSTGNTLISFYYNNGYHTGIRFVNNRVENGSIGIYLHQLHHDGEYLIQGNSFINQYAQGIHSYNGGNYIISQNHVESNRNYSSFRGISMQFPRNSCQVNKNRIIQKDGAGIDISSGDSLIAVHNNFVSVLSGGGNQGINLSSSKRIELWHNNILVNASGTEGIAVWIKNNDARVSMLNNVLVNKANGLLLAVRDSQNLTSLNNNIYFSPGNEFWGIGSPYISSSFLTYGDLPSWQLASGLDTASLFLDPEFYSDSNLHVQKIALNSAARSGLGVIDDIDGELRSSSPDIGADEFTPVGMDVQLVDLILPQAPFAAGNYPLMAVIRNHGTQPLNTLQIVSEVNGGIPDTFVWNTSLPVGKQDTITFGTQTFNPLIVYNFSCWTQNPNGQQDVITKDDSLEVNDIWVSLGGAYTVGGTNPDIPDLASMALVLSNAGILDTVWFNIRPGTYQERVAFYAYPGMSCETPVYIQSESGDRTDVTWQFNAGSSNNFRARLDGVSGLVFQNLTIRATNSYGRVIDIRNGSHCNQFINNHLVGWNVNSTSSRYAVVYSPGGSGPLIGDTSNVFLQNHIQYGTYGILMQGYNQNNPEKGTRLEGNFFENQRYRATALNYQESIVVLDNVLETNNNSQVGRAISLFQNTGAPVILRNQIDMPKGFGIVIDGHQNAAGDSSLIANNMIYIAGSQNAKGIYIKGDRQKVYYNSVWISSSDAADGRAFELNSGQGVILKNNILVNTGGGYAIYLACNTGLDSDYNNLYTGATRWGYDCGVVADLAAWQLNGQDVNSISIDPDFVSTTDLHVNASGLNGAGIPLTEVIDDFDKELRDTQTPDIGADEFTPPLRDEAEMQVIFVPQRPFVAGAHPLRVAIRNGGTDTLRTLRIDWEVNGIPQSSFNWSGMLPTGIADTFAIGTFNFLPGINHHVTSWVNLPNGIPDSLNVNDTIRASEIFVALGGIYSVGGTNPDFIDFSSTAENLKHGGLLDSVVFQIRDGIYHGSLSLGEIAESSPANFVRYEGERGDSAQVVLRDSSASGACLEISELDYLTFRHLTFERTNGSGSNPRVVNLLNGIEELTFDNCRFVGLPQSSSGTGTALVYMNSYYHSGIYFHQNEFLYGSFGFWAQTAFNNYSDSLFFTENTFENQAYMAVKIQYVRHIQFRKNQIRNGVLSLANHEGIDFRNCQGTVQIEKNQIYTPGGKYGMFLQNMSGVDSRVVNNFVRTGGSSNGAGIFYSGFFNQEIAHNSVVYEGNSLTDGAAIQVGGGNFNDVENNIFANVGGGYAVKLDANSGYSGRNNNLFVAGNNIGKYLSNTASNLSGWQTLASNDINSISVDPLFVAPDDPHVLQAALDSAGTIAPYVTTDIDDEPRNYGYPDIGADEFDVLLKDLSLEALLEPQTGCGLGMETVSLRISNPALQRQDSFRIGYVLDGNPAVIEWVRSAIQPAQQLTVSFQTLADLTTSGMHSLDVFVLLNGDENTANDSLRGIQIENLPLGNRISNLLPPDSTLGLSSPVTFSWNPLPNTASYDFYLWNSKDPKPLQPTDSNIFATQYVYSGNLLGNESFKWQVIPDNACPQQQASDELSFFTPLLPDLTIDTIIIPVTAFSGQDVTISWSVINQGQASTGSTSWRDEVWLSVDTVLNLFNNTFEIYLGSRTRPAGLGPGQSYSQTATFSLPQTAIGPYHVFVRTAKRQVVRESIYSNNRDFTPDTLHVQLTPPPDLQVPQVIAPQTAFSGEWIDVNYTVKNEGTGPSLSGDWYDEIYLSQDPFLDTRRATRLSRHRIRQNLEADSSYKRYRRVKLPNGIYGVYYVHVLTDADNDEFEYVLEQNNEGSSDSLTIVLSPPIDLIVDSVWTQDSVSAKELVTLFWRVKNQGAADVNSSFVDQIYLSTQPDSNLVASDKKGSLTNSVVLPAGSSLVKSRIVTMPDAPDGQYYFYVKTDDKNHVYEYVFEDNNIGRTLGPVEVLAPDLQVVDFELPDSATANQNTAIGWTLFNAGPGKVYNRGWKDRVMLSRHPVFDPDSVIVLGNVNRYGLIEVGDSSRYARTFRLPNGLSGDYFVYLRTDDGSFIFEGAGETNNLVRSLNSFYIKLPQWPDLQLTKAQLPGSIQGGDSLQMTFTIKNAGLGQVFGKRWIDRLYVQLDSVFNVNDANLIKTSTRAVTLQADSSYSISYDNAFPRIHQLKGGQGLDSAHVYLFLQLDEGNDLFENTGEANNLFRSDSIFIRESARPDLLLSAIGFQADSLWSGQQASIDWTVENTGKSTRFWKSNSWFDRLYLSADSSFDAVQDILLVNRSNIQALDQGDSYTNTRSFKVPIGIHGDYYLFALTDAQQAVPENMRANNLALLRKVNGAARSIHIQLSPSPDLSIKTLLNPISGTAGQPIDILWEVENEGVAATTGSGWIDRFYLSRDSVWDGADLLVGGKAHLSNLNPGQRYNDSVNLNLPKSAQGNYYLMARVDYRDDVYEHQAEANNQALRLITVDQPLPIDLTVTEVIAPDSAFLGEALTIEWEVFNQGMNPANAYMTEAVYLSTDTLWDPGDVLLGTIRRKLNLPSQATVRRSLTTKLTLNSLHDYHVIVRTDITDRFTELDENNNTGFRGELMGIRAHELALGLWQQDTLEDRQEIYYRIHIPDSMVREDMLVELLGDANIGQAELYLRYGDLPSQAVQDYASLTPYVNRQEVIISSVQKGDYYLMAFADNIGKLEQAIELRAMILPFEVREVDAKQGGNTGSVTIKIKGSQFQNYTDFALQDSGQTILASQVYYLSRVEVFATFNLRDVSLGDYDVVAINAPGDSARLVDGFAVVTGSLGAGLGQGGSVGSGTGGLGAAGISCSIQNVGMNKNLSVWIDGPSLVRINRPYFFTIHYRNDGNVDLPLPVRPLVSVHETPIAFERKDLVQGLTELMIEMKEEGGPPGLLRPGGGGRVIIQFKVDPRGEMKFILLL